MRTERFAEYRCVIWPVGLAEDAVSEPGMFVSGVLSRDGQYQLQAGSVTVARTADTDHSEACKLVS